MKFASQDNPKVLNTIHIIDYDLLVLSAYIQFDHRWQCCTSKLSQFAGPSLCVLGDLQNDVIIMTKPRTYILHFDASIELAYKNTGLIL